jgi:hypothetical protein
MRSIIGNGNAFKPPRISLVALGTALAVTAAVAWCNPASATTFDLATLNDYITGSGRQLVNHGYFTGINGTGTEIFNSAGNQLNPWTQSLGNPDQASLNFTVPTMGNNAGKIYMSAGALFPVPTGQVVGQNQSGYSGDYNLGNGFPLYFAFSNPTYDNPCGFNCNTITQVPVAVNSLWTTDGAGSTITGYSDLGHTVVDTTTITGTGLQQITLNWTGIEEIAISGGGYYINDIEVNDPIAPAVAEPSTWAMLVLGFAGIGLLGYRRQNKMSFRMV